MGNATCPVVDGEGACCATCTVNGIVATTQCFGRLNATECDAVSPGACTNATFPGAEFTTELILGEECVNDTTCPSPPTTGTSGTTGDITDACCCSCSLSINITTGNTQNVTVNSCNDRSSIDTCGPGNPVDDSFCSSGTLECVRVNDTMCVGGDDCPVNFTTSGVITTGQFTTTSDDTTGSTGTTGTTATTATTGAVTTGLVTTGATITGASTTGDATTGAATTGAATTGIATTGVATTGIATTGVATTGVATTGVATTGVATTGIATTGVATTGVATTGVATTGVATTGVATTGVATTGIATTGVATTGVATTGGATTGGIPTACIGVYQELNPNVPSPFCEIGPCNSTLDPFLFLLEVEANLPCPDAFVCCIGPLTLSGGNNVSTTEQLCLADSGTPTTFPCPGTPPFCGNGILEAPEECDDGNIFDGDGCSSTCTLELIQDEAPCGVGCLSGSIISASTPVLGATTITYTISGGVLCNTSYFALLDFPDCMAGATWSGSCVTGSDICTVDGGPLCTGRGGTCSDDFDLLIQGGLAGVDFSGDCELVLTLPEPAIFGDVSFGIGGGDDPTCVSCETILGPTGCFAPGGGDIVPMANCSWVDGDVCFTAFSYMSSLNGSVVIPKGEFNNVSTTGIGSNSDNLPVLFDPGMSGLSGVIFDCNDGPAVWFLDGNMESSDSAASMCEDCNNNSIPDPLEVINNPSLDCNNNSIPDECELNESTDTNDNGILDECEPEDDDDDTTTVVIIVIVVILILLCIICCCWFFLVPERRRRRRGTMRKERPESGFTENPLRTWAGRGGTGQLQVPLMQSRKRDD